MKLNEVDETAPQEDPEAIDLWLRRELEPRPEQVSRVVQRALTADESIPESKRVSWRTAVLVATGTSVVVVLLTVIVARFVHEPSRPPVPPGERDGPTEIAATITNQSGEVELRLHAGTGEERIVPAGPSIRIFNQGGLVAAAVTNGGIRYMVIGGDR